MTMKENAPLGLLLLHACAPVWVTSSHWRPGKTCGLDCTNRRSTGGIQALLWFSAGFTLCEVYTCSFLLTGPETCLSAPCCVCEFFKKTKTKKRKKRDKADVWVVRFYTAIVKAHFIHVNTLLEKLVMCRTAATEVGACASLNGTIK